MGGSYRAFLKNGDMPRWEEPLRRIVGDLDTVLASIYESASEEDQYDNAADTGGLAEKLSIARRFITEELPDC
jgi:hypothetical protein